jgi:hypothetical protein
MKHSHQVIVIVLVLGSIFMGIIYLWFVSIGTWTQLSQTSTYYYRMLADGFLVGSPALLIEPDPRLATIDNPYPPENRENIPIIMDAAYYEGKYYLYYGPAPGVILTVFMYLFKRPVSDGYFTFLSAWMLFLFSALIILRLWRAHFIHTPIWLLVLSLLSTGTMYPLLYATNSARIYEAAELTSSAFVMAGLFFVFGTLDEQKPNNLYLLLAGVCWGLAIGSRLFSLVIIAVLCIAILLRLTWREGKILLTPKNIINFSHLLAPIGFAFTALGWYNFIRFDNPIETGLRYSLIGIKGVSSFYFEGNFFRLRYFLPNLTNYLLNPIKISNGFPFVALNKANGTIHELITGTVQGYTREGIAGLLITMPMIIFIGFYIWFVIMHKKMSRATGNSIPQFSDITKFADLYYLNNSTGLAVLMGLMVLSFYYVVTTRFLLDFIALLNLVMITGVWLSYEWFKRKSTHRTICSSLIIILTVYSVGLSFLLAMTGEINRFQNFNPELFERIFQLFT